MPHVYGLDSAPWSGLVQDPVEAGLPALVAWSPFRTVTHALLKQLRQHHAPTAAYSIRVARVLMWMWAAAPEELGDPELLLVGGALHDVGKLFISAATLGSGRVLDTSELAVIRRHPEAGADVLRNLGFPPLVVAAARDHHERWSGGGYPSKRPAAEMHYVARATAVADAYVAMVEPGRSYRSPLSRREAFIEIASCRGTHFDPEVADILITSVAGQPTAAFEACAASWIG